ncbi:MAG TPA: hypothetical protein VEO36_03240 [Casimicrobiaceae bacterium]|nr:hypothetical protein [Casimicrobiaceae bacterium]
MVAEHLASVDLGIDLPALHAPLDLNNPHPGRMAFNTALAFVLIGTVLATMRNVQGAAGISLLTVLVLGATAIGVTGIVGYVLGVEFIYAWFGYTSMALHTAVGLTVAGGALASLRARCRRIGSTLPPILPSTSAWWAQRGSSQSRSSLALPDSS